MNICKKHFFLNTPNSKQYLSIKSVLSFHIHYHQAYANHSYLMTLYRLRSSSRQPLIASQLEFSIITNRIKKNFHLIFSFFSKFTHTPMGYTPPFLMYHLSQSLLTIYILFSQLVRTQKKNAKTKHHEQNIYNPYSNNFSKHHD